MQGASTDLYDYSIPPARLKICRRPDGSDFKLGSGGSGVVSQVICAKQAHVLQCDPCQMGPLKCMHELLEAPETVPFSIG